MSTLSCQTSSLALPGSSRLCKIAHPDRDLRCPKKKSPSGGWGARRAGAFDLRDKNSSRDRRYNVRPANWIACIFLLLLLFSASSLKIVCRSGSSVTRSQRRRHRSAFWHRNEPLHLG